MEYDSHVCGDSTHTAIFNTVKSKAFRLINNILKRAVTEDSVLSFPNYKLPFTLCTDESALGIGAVLMQTVEGSHPHVIAYASCTFTHAESRYSVIHMKALAVVWELQHFRDIIFG